MRGNSTRRAGFSLLEMSVVVVIIGTVIGALAVLLGSQIKQSQYKDTQAKLAVIQKALYDYRRAYDRLPCPADVTVGYNDPIYSDKGLLFGAEAQLWFNAYIGTGCFDSNTYYPSANIIEDYNFGYGVYGLTRIAEGMVPTRALGLADDYAIDGWGRRIMYAVDISATSPSLTKRIPLPDPGTVDTAAGRIVIASYNAAVTKTSYALYALISYGADGHGGWVRNHKGFGDPGGLAPVNANNINDSQKVNCNCDPDNPNTYFDPQYPTDNSTVSDAGITGYPGLGLSGGIIGYFNYSNNASLNSISSPTFIQSTPVQDSSTPNGTNDFDDIVVYATRADLPGYRE